jgi:glycosyltransferase involved in cell wall biosynthesis
VAQAATIAERRRPVAAHPPRLRVLHLLPHARALGGTERTVIDLLSAPALAQFDQRVAFFQPGVVHGFPPSSVLGGSAARRLPGGSLPAILRWKPDVLHGWLLQGNLLGAVVKLMLPSARLITSERHAESLPYLKRQLERVVAWSEDAVTGNSAAVRTATIARVPKRAARFRVILPGVAPPIVSTEPRPATAVTVARFHPLKDHMTALRTWRDVIDRRPEETLTLVGDGPGRTALERVAHELGLGSTVRFLGETDPTPDLFGAKMLLSTSLSEGFSRAVMEALGAGLPVVSTNVGGMAELQGPAVRIAAVGDHAALAAHVLSWLDDPDELRRASDAAREVSQRFSPERFHSAHARLYLDIAERVHG